MQVFGGLLLQTPKIDLKPDYVGILMDTVKMGSVIYQVLRFSSVIIIPLLICTHIF
jgi:hypothetical protein